EHVFGMAAEHELDARFREAVRNAAEILELLRVRRADARAARDQQTRRRVPALGEADDQHVLVLQLDHRSFRVASPIKARRMAMIQKRTITRGSGHPFNSKW